VILTAHATKVNHSEPNWTEPQTRMACQNHACCRPMRRHGTDDDDDEDRRRTPRPIHKVPRVSYWGLHCEKLDLPW